MTGRFAIIELPDNGPLPAEAIVVGGLDEIMQFLPQTVAYQELESRALGLVDQLTKREQAFNDGLATLAPSIGHFMDVCGRLVDGEEAYGSTKRRRRARRPSALPRSQQSLHLSLDQKVSGRLPLLMMAN
jgi:hypothetical protein